MNEEIRKAGAERKRTPASDTPRLCELYARELVDGAEIIRILRDDPGHCGMGERVLDQMEASRARLEESAGRICGN